MNWKDAVIDRSPAQRKLRIELLKLEAKPLGYVLVRASYLNQLIKRLPVADRAEAMVEAVR